MTAQLALPAWAFAQTLPDAGILQQQIDRDRKQALPPAALPSQAARPTEAKPPQGLTLEVKRFKFVGRSLLPDQTVAAAVAGFLNRPIDFAQLQEAAAAAAAAKKPAKGDEDSRPRFWTKYPSSRLNEKKEGEGLDLEAERKVHEAHERREKVCLGPAGSAATSPGSGVAAAMAKLGRESLSMAD